MTTRHFANIDYQAPVIQGAEQPVKTKGAKNIQHVEAKRRYRKFGSADMASAQRVYMRQGEVAEKEEINRLQQIAKQMADEDKQLRKEKAPPRLTALPSNRIRINDTIVFKTTERLIKVIERVIVTYANDPKVADPVFVLEKAEGTIDRSDRSKLNASLIELSQGKYKRDGRISRYIHFRSIDILYSPIERDTIDFSVIRLSHTWAIKGPQEFISKVNAAIEGCKHMSYGYKKQDYIEVMQMFEKINKITTVDDNGMRDAIKNDETGEELQVKVAFLEFVNRFNIVIPENLEVYEVAPLTTAVETSQMVKSYIDLVHLLRAEGIDEFPELKSRIQDQIASLRDKIDDVITDVKDLVFFENFDYEPLPLEEKELVTNIWEHAIDVERKTRLKTLRVEHVFERAAAKKKGKKRSSKKRSAPRRPQLAVYDITDVDVPDTLRKVAVTELDAEHLNGAELEPIFYDAYSNDIRKYVFAIARILAVIKLDPDIQLSQRIQNGDVENLLEPSNDQLLPELYLNRKLTGNKRQLERLKRFITDISNDQANLILYNWQPAVKRDWFPVSTGPNPIRVTWKEFMLQDISGGTCGDNKIFIRTANGIRCFDRNYIIANINEFKKYNNRSDLDEWLGEPEGIKGTINALYKMVFGKND